ncbi:protein zer-1 homolog [Gigantopelta aegis]|uniref:protein zer-1 homolog n=1 Tax=Gigantopelta aegis TaxID=1735272 RepID=UPI001B88CE2F|nr:protein zer-1 homolog [Gigantopelta aegis]
MAVDQWPPNNPSCLEDICVQFCVTHLETFTEVIDPDSKTFLYKLQAGLSLPKVICDKLLQGYIDSAENVDDSFLNIFSDTNVTQLTNLDLRCSDVTDAGLRLVQNQPILNLDLSHCDNITADCVESISAVGKTLGSLRMSTTPTDIPIFEYLHHCCHLRHLSLCNFPFEDRSLPSALSHLMHADFTGCSLSYDFLEGLGCLSGLVSLSLADVNLPDLDEILLNICKLKYLRHLDLSQSMDESVAYRYFVEHDDTEPLKVVMDCLPCLTSLDISGTNLAGFEVPEVTSHRLGPANQVIDSNKANSNCEEQIKCSIPGLEDRHLEFLGLFGCPYDACSREHIPASKVTGEHNEDQLILALQVYRDRTNFLIRVLNNLFECFQATSVVRWCDVLDGILIGMERHPKERDVQISGSASLFYIAKGEKKGNITQKQKRKIIRLLLTGMRNFNNEQTMMRNGCLTLCHFNIPFDVMFCYKMVVKVLLQMLEVDHRDNFIHRIGIFLLNSLACQVDGKEKELVGDMGAIETMLFIIQNKLRERECDEIMEVAWSTMWNVTDETPPNCERFLDHGGMELFLKCLKHFEEKPELLRNMMGLMGNIAEVKYLRPRLMVTKYVTVFSNLLNSTSDGIEVSYNAAGVLAHMASDGADAWTIDKPTREEMLATMVKAIRRWDIKSSRNINYRSFEPILRLLSAFDTPQVQHWAVWALCNLCGFNAERYCLLLEKEKGVVLLQNLLKDARPYTEIKHLARQLLLQVKGNTTTNIDVCMDVSFDDDVGTSVDLGVGAVCDNMDGEDGGGDTLRVVVSHEPESDRANQNHVVEQGLCDGRGDNLNNKVLLMEGTDDEDDPDLEDFL